MNDTPPLTAEQVDELLSAELDGEFDAAARDLGFDPADARDRLATDVPGLVARRAALEGARDALAELPAVDELVAARVRAKAVKAAAAEHEVGQASRSHRVRRLTAIAGGLAAAIAVIGGLALTVQHNSGSASKTSTAAPHENKSASRPKAAGATTTGGAGAPVDLGAAADVPALVARARLQVSRLARTSAPESKAVFGSDSAIARGVATPCEHAADQVSGVGSPSLRAVATLSGTPVQVYVFQAGADVVVVVLRADCRLVAKQTMRAPSG
jgi:hypothetical protein